MTLAVGLAASPAIRSVHSVSRGGCPWLARIKSVRIMASTESAQSVVPFRGRRVDKPWGYELIWAETSHYAGKILHIERGQQLSFQYHRHKDETVYVLSGVLELELASADGPRRTVRLQPGESLHIIPELRHRMTAIETCEVLEASTPELDDVVRLEDRYGRT